MEEIQKIDTVVVNGVDYPFGGQGGGGGMIIHECQMSFGHGGVYLEPPAGLNLLDCIENPANMLNHVFVGKSEYDGRTEAVSIFKIAGYYMVDDDKLEFNLVDGSGYPVTWYISASTGDIAQDY